MEWTPRGTAWARVGRWTYRKIGKFCPVEPDLLPCALLGPSLRIVPMNAPGNEEQVNNGISDNSVPSGGAPSPNCPSPPQGGPHPGAPYPPQQQSPGHTPPQGAPYPGGYPAGGVTPQGQQGMPGQAFPGMGPQGAEGMPPRGPYGMPPQGPGGVPPQGPGGMPPQGPPPYGQPPYGPGPGPVPSKRKGGRIAIIIVVIALILGSLGLWWLTKNKAGFAAGAKSPEAGLELFEQRINEADYAGLVDLISPEERQYYSSLFMQAALMQEQGEEGDPERTEEALGGFSEIFNDHVSMEANFDLLDTYTLNEEMTAVAATGSYKFVIDDPEQFIDDLFDFLIEQEKAHENNPMNIQYMEMARTEAKDSIAESDNGGQLEPLVFTEEDPLVMSFVKERGGWYFTTGESFLLTGFYDDMKAAVDAGRSLDIPKLDKGFSNPTEASAQMLENLANATPNELLAYLPKVERRFLATALFLDETGEVENTTLGATIDISGIETTTVEVSDHFAITPITAFSLSMPAFAAGENTKISLSDGKLLISRCAEPIDTLGLLGEPNNLLALGTIKDDEGWHVSIGGTVIHVAGAVSQLGPGILSLSSVFNQIDACMGDGAEAFN